MADITAGFSPQPLGLKSHIIQQILEVVPFANFSDPSWGFIEGPGFVIEVNMGEGEIIESFAFHVRGGDEGANIVASILTHLKLRAVDPSSESGFFETEHAVRNLSRWREYRDRVIEGGSVHLP